jgi:hypothetical protein
MHVAFPLFFEVGLGTEQTDRGCFGQVSLGTKCTCCSDDVPDLPFGGALTIYWATVTKPLKSVGARRSDRSHEVGDMGEILIDAPVSMIIGIFGSSTACRTYGVLAISGKRDMSTALSVALKSMVATNA